MKTNLKSRMGTMKLKGRKGSGHRGKEPLCKRPGRDATPEAQATYWRNRLAARARQRQKAHEQLGGRHYVTANLSDRHPDSGITPQDRRGTYIHDSRNGGVE